MYLDPQNAKRSSTKGRSNPPSPPVWMLVSVGIVLLVSIATNWQAAKTYPAWMDEAWLSDIAYHYTKEGVWQWDLAPTKVPAWFYGPVYFDIQRLIIQLFGFDALTLRAPIILATYLVALLASGIVLIRTERKMVAAAILLLLLLDPSLNRATVSGRMDMIASLLALSSFSLALRYPQLRMRVTLLASLLASLAFLTTPRAAFLLPGTAVLLVMNALQHRATAAGLVKIGIHLFISIFVFLVPVALWMNSIGGIGYYLDAIRGSTHLANHEGVSLFRTKEDYVLIPLLFLSLLLVWRRAIRDRAIVSIGVTFLCFTLFVKEVGPYRPMILPYLYVALGIIATMILERHQNKRQRIVQGALVVGLVVSLPTFIFRTADVWLVNTACRDGDRLQSTLLSMIPPNKSVVAGYEFFYWLKPNANRFTAFEAGDRPAKDQLPDYVVLSGEAVTGINRETDQRAAILRSNYKAIGTFSCRVNTFGLPQVFYGRRNYSGTTVYRNTAILGD